MTSSPAWAHAGVIGPWVIHERYGNTRILADNFEAMQRWVDYQQRTSNELIRPSSGFGDWLALGGATPSSLIGTASFAHTAFCSGSRPTASSPPTGRLRAMSSPQGHRATVPPNTTATIRLPDGTSREVGGIGFLAFDWAWSN